MSRSNPDKVESPSKLLRDSFYRLWKKDSEEFEDFEDYYKSKMQKLIEYYNKLLKK